MRGFEKNRHSDMRKATQVTKDFTRDRCNDHPDLPPALMKQQYTYGETIQATIDQRKNAFGSLASITRMNDGNGGSPEAAEPTRIETGVWKSLNTTIKHIQSRYEIKGNSQKKYDKINTSLENLIKKLDALKSDDNLNDDDYRDLEVLEQHIPKRVNDPAFEEGIKNCLNHLEVIFER